MKKYSKIKLCIIGAMNFGKSSFVESLWHLGTNTNAVIHIKGNQKKIAQMQTALKNKQQLSSTDWNEINKFKFEMQENINKKWQVSFFDYPGELFAKFFEEHNFIDIIKKLLLVEKHEITQNNNVAKQETQTTTQESATEKPEISVIDTTFNKATAHKAKKLISKLKKSDAIIILVPADIKEKKYDEYRLMYMQTMPDFIKRVIKHNPEIPIYFCINKWDMFDCGIENLEEKLNEQPFNQIYSSLKKICGDNLEVTAFSAFGSHDPSDKEKIDKNNERKPINVVETLLKIVKKIEKVRYECISAEWKKSNLLKKAFYFPKQISDVLKKGSANKNIRNGLLKMYAKSIGLFAGFVFSFLIIIVIFIAGIFITLEWKALANIKKQLATYKIEYDSEYVTIKATKNELAKTAVIRSTVLIWYEKKLKEDYRNIEKKIIKDVEQFRNKLENKDISALGNPEERKSRLETRIKKIENAQNAMLNQHHSLDNLLIQEKTLEKDLIRNNEFYQQVYNHLRLGTLRQIRKFIDDNKTTYPQHKQIFDNLENELQAKEKKLAKELKDKLNKLKVQNATKENQKKLIEEYEQKFTDNSKYYKPFKDQAINLEQNISTERRYKPFNDSYKGLDKNNLRAVADFLQKYSEEKYSDKKGTIQELKNKKIELTEKIKQNLTSDISANQDNDASPAKQRLDNLKNRIKSYNSAKEKFIVGSQEINDINNKISAEDTLKKKLEKFEKFEEKANKIVKSDDLRAIADFERDYKKDDYEGKYNSDLFNQIERRKTSLSKNITETLNTELKASKEALNLNAATNKAKAERRKKAYETARNKYILNSKDWNKANTGVTQSVQDINKWENYINFDTENTNLNRDDLNKITEFLDKYPKKEYSIREKEINGLERRQKELINSIVNDLIESLADAKDDPSKSADIRIQKYNNRISAYNKAKNNLGKFSQRIDNLKPDDTLTKLQEYKKFEEDAHKLLAGKDEGKLRNIHNFKQQYKENDYTDKFHVELFKKINKIEQGLLQSINAELTGKLESNKEDTCTAEENVRRAKERKNACNTAKNKFVTDSEEWKQADKQYRNAETSEKMWNKYVQLEKDYNIIKSISDTKKLPKIAKFTEQYKQKDYPHRKEYFTEIKTIKTTTEKNLSDKFTNEQKNIKKENENDFAAMSRYWEKMFDLHMKYENYYPENSKNREDHKHNSDNAKNERDKYKKWNEIRIAANGIKAFDNKTQKNKEQSLLLQIKDFYKKYSETNYSSVTELKNDFTSVKNIQNNAAAILQNKLESELQGYSLDVGDEKEKQENYKNRIRKIDEYLPYFSGEIRTTYDSRKNSYMRQLSDSQKEELFNKAKKELDDALKGNQIANNEKIEKIKTFLTTYSGHKEQCPHIFKEFENNQTKYEKMNDWDDLKHKIEVNLKRPDSTDTKSLSDYKVSCNKYLTKIKKYSKITYITDYLTQEKEIDEKIKWVESQIGDGSFANIQDKENEYKEDPSKENYEELQEAIHAFDKNKPENKEHIEKVNIITENSEKDWKIRSGIKEAWDNLYERPNLATWNSFGNECNKILDPHGRISWKYTEDNSILEEYIKKYKNLANEFSFYVELRGVDNLQTLGEVAGEKRVKFKYGNNTLWNFKCENYSWYAENVDKVIEEDGNRKNIIKTKINETLKFDIVTIGNWQPQNTKGDFVTFHIDSIKILVKLVNGEIVENKYERKYENEDKAVIMVLRFSME